MICSASQLTDFYMMAISVFNVLIRTELPQKNCFIGICNNTKKCFGTLKEKEDIVDLWSFITTSVFDIYQFKIKQHFRDNRNKNCITHNEDIFYFRSSRSQMFFKISVPKNFAKLTGKHLCQSHKVVGVSRVWLWHRCFFLWVL